MTNEELIREAEKVLKPYKSEDGRLHADVGAAILDKEGNLYTGVCVDTASWGLCAERSAIAAMVTNGNYKLDKVVAVWKDDKTNQLHVLPPCGHCREFMRSLDQENLEADIILGKTDIKKLKDLIPYNEWPGPLED
ncbi:MAG: cytidine deaminase [Candidatus Paceibacterota bacterium]